MSFFYEKISCFLLFDLADFLPEELDERDVRHCWPGIGTSVSVLAQFPVKRPEVKLSPDGTNPLPAIVHEARDVAPDGFGKRESRHTHCCRPSPIKD